jgi:hypothetical protein
MGIQICDEIFPHVLRGKYPTEKLSWPMKSCVAIHYLGVQQACKATIKPGATLDMYLRSSRTIPYLNSLSGPYRVWLSMPQAVLVYFWLYVE